MIEAGVMRSAQLTQTTNNQSAWVFAYLVADRAYRDKAAQGAHSPKGNVVERLRCNSTDVFCSMSTSAPMYKFF